MSMYFVLALSKRNRGWLRDWRLGAVTVLAAASSAEVLQGLGVPLLGRTFDPLDFLAYATGVAIAVVMDRLLLPALCGRGTLPDR